MAESLVIVGNGMAAARLIENIIAREASRFDITVVGEEPAPAYNRVLLSSLLAGEVAPQDLPLRPEAWWRSAGVHVMTGVRVTAVSPARKEVMLSDGRALSFSQLVLATGASALQLPLPGSLLPEVLCFRTLDDTARLIALAEEGKKLAVIGGGLLGIEAAHGLARRGAAVTLVHLLDRLMERQLDVDAAGLVQAALVSRGIEVILNARSERILGDDHVRGLRLADGRTIAADAVVMAAGIAPNADLARAARLAVDKGIVTDARLQTSVPGIYALGECAQVLGQCCGLVAPVHAQAEVLAAVLLGEDSARYTPAQEAANLKVSGLPVFSAGDISGENGASSIVLRAPSQGLYKKLVVRHGRLKGVVMVGDTSDSGWYLKLMRDKTPVEPFRSTLAFGRAYCDGAHKHAA